MTTTAEVQLTALDDRAQLRWASGNPRIIETYNAADFCKLHREFIETNQQHAGIVIMEQQRLSLEKECVVWCGFAPRWTLKQ